jgi:hypothetical protein
VISPTTTHAAAARATIWDRRRHARRSLAGFSFPLAAFAFTAVLPLAAAFASRATNASAGRAVVGTAWDDLRTGAGAGRGIHRVKTRPSGLTGPNAGPSWI